MSRIYRRWRVRDVAILLSLWPEHRKAHKDPELERYNDLAQNVPNPFNPTTQLGYQIAADVRVTLAVYDVAGKLVQTLVDKQQSAGGYTETWDGHDNKGRLVSSGVYFYRLTAGDYVQTRRMVMLK